MRGLLRRVGARTSTAIVLIVTVALTLVVARLVDDGRTALPGRPPTFTPPVLETVGDDSADDIESTAFPDDATVLAVGEAFAAAWAHPERATEQWLDGLRPHATEALIDSLSGVEPSEVPAHATLGEPAIRTRTETHAEVLVPIGPHDALVLGLVGTDDGWLVATLDRETG